MRDDHFIVVADDAATRRLVEQVRDAAVRHPLGPVGGPLLGRAGLARVGVEVARGVQDLPRVPDRRQEADVFRVVDVGGPPVARELPLPHHVVDNLVEPELQAVLVLPDEVEHVVRNRDRRIVPGHLEVPVGPGELHDELIAQHERDRFPPGDVYRGEVEWLDGTGCLCAGLGGQSQQNDRKSG